MIKYNYIVILIVLIILIGCRVEAQRAKATPPAGGSPSEFIFGSGLDKGPIPLGTYGLAISNINPGTTAMLEWQQDIVRTGTGAYHFVGGSIPSGDLDIINASGFDFGGLEVWVGGAFQFTSFPDIGLDPVIVMAAVPTDGTFGANNKPQIMIDSNGHLRLQNSNVQTQTVLTTNPLLLNRWYYVLIHGLNDAFNGDNTLHTQELYIYDDTDTLIEVLGVEMNINGSFTNQDAKWGFGTSQDTHGTEFYLDDLFFRRGNWDPKVIRVETLSPNSTNNTGLFEPDDTTLQHLYLSEIPPNDGNFLASNAAVVNQASYTLPLLENSPNEIMAIQVNVRGKRLGSKILFKAGFLADNRKINIGSSFTNRQFTTYINPITGQSWQQVDLIPLLCDCDTRVNQFQVSELWYEVVYE